uniref:beta-mannosidase n=1 Tax=Arcella intermedia TaxID=1963864 RepID=A0A6B2L3J8_9EUKA
MTRSWLLVVGLFLLALGRVTGKGLRDDPIVGDFVQYLDEYTWKASSAPRSVAATVPGDLITDLWRAGAVGDPMVEENWLVSGLWDKNDWNYTVTFPSDMPNGVTELVFDGVKMGAYVYLNDAFLGTINNQFLRYRFPITPILKSSNTLVVSFPAQSKGIDCEGRYMACTGGWDWAPYSNTVDQHNSPTMTKGIWKSVYTMSYSSVAISHIVPQIFYQGEYPTSILSDSSHDGFVVRVGVNLTAARNMDGLLLVSGDWGVAQTSLLKLNKGENFEVIELAAKDVKLWWPIGLGEQNLYNIKVSWEPKDATVVSTTRQIGFRVFTLVSANDTDPSTLKGKDGSSSFTLRFKVNGANVYSRGANVIPMEEFEGRANVNALRQLVQSAADAKMNTLRVWGGGIFMYDEFYDACDRLGILVYQDMMYAQIGHFPAATQSQLNELIHQVSRLSHHPSIVLWDGCNE